MSPQQKELGLRFDQKLARLNQLSLPIEFQASTPEILSFDDLLNVLNQTIEIPNADESLEINAEYLTTVLRKKSDNHRLTKLNVSGLKSQLLLILQHLGLVNFSDLPQYMEMMSRGELEPNPHKLMQTLGLKCAYQIAQAAADSYQSKRHLDKSLPNMGTLNRNLIGRVIEEKRRDFWGDESRQSEILIDTWEKYLDQVKGTKLEKDYMIAYRNDDKYQAKVKNLISFFYLAHTGARSVAPEADPEYYKRHGLGLFWQPNGEFSLSGGFDTLSCKVTKSGNFIVVASILTNSNYGLLPEMPDGTPTNNVLYLFNRVAAGAVGLLANQYLRRVFDNSIESNQSQKFKFTRMRYGPNYRLRGDDQLYVRHLVLGDNGEIKPYQYRFTPANLKAVESIITSYSHALNQMTEAEVRNLTAQMKQPRLEGF